MFVVVSDEIGRPGVFDAPFDSIYGGKSTMKMVTCIVRPEKLDAITTALDKMHIVGMTVTDVRGFGRQKGQVEHYRGGEYTIRFISKVRIDVAVQDEDVKKVMEAVSKISRTDNVGDGKIFVTPVENAMRIRTGEVGTSAL
jgi:nitrogen regulatory protein P-II 2